MGTAPLLQLVRFFEGATHEGDRYMVVIAGLHVCEIGAADADVVFAGRRYAWTDGDNPGESVFTFEDERHAVRANGHGSLVLVVREGR